MSIPVNTEVEGEIEKKKLPGGKYVVLGVELTGSLRNTHMHGKNCRVADGK
ncbi:MAG: hypothetical protein R2741_15585 [Methanolobus sp.]